MSDREPFSNAAAANLDSIVDLSACTPGAHPWITTARDTGNQRA
jgi:hypothetical protein